MRNSLRLAVVTCLLFFSVGCFRHDYFVSGTTPEARPHSDWRHHILFGLIDLNADVDLRELCPQGVAHIESEMEFFNVVFALLTAGIYAPSTIDVYCQASPVPPLAPSSPVATEVVEEVPVLEEGTTDASGAGAPAL